MGRSIRLLIIVGTLSVWRLGPAPFASAQTVCQDARLTASDGAPFRSFGYALAVSGDTALIGAPWNNEQGVQSGAVYVFRFEGKNWIETQKLLAPDGDGSDQFGVAVALAGETAVIGAFGHQHDDESGSGSAYVFRYNGSTWMEEQELLASDGMIGDHFGRSLSLSADTIVVGADTDDDNGSNAGAAYVFRYDPDTSQWVEEQKLLASDGTDADFFGTAVAVFGEVALVGAPGDDDTCPGDPICDSGAVYVFRFDAKTSTWMEEQKLIASDSASGDELGLSLSISPDVALIGAPFDVSGSAYVFRFDPKTSTWVQEQELIPSGGQPNQFGRAVTVDGDIAVIGSPFADAVGNDQGAAYVFRYDHKISQWSQEDMLVPDPNPWTAFFGRSVAIDGETAVIGALGEDQQRGAAYVFDLALNCNCPHDLDLDGSVGVSDLLALLASWGPCPPKADCPADFDGNGNVGVSDLLALLANWGPCP